MRGNKYGPFSREDVIGLLRAGEINADAMVKQNGVWVNITEVPWLTNEFEQSPETINTIPVTDNFCTEDVLPEPQDKIFICPHCWNEVRTSKIKYISKHTELIGDSVLGSDAQSRFVPTVFNEQGYAIDAKGIVCQDMACPTCHLKIPESVMDFSTISFSIVGAPASGKSYYLTSMIWQLRSTLSQKFSYTLVDADPSINLVLNKYEQTIFLNKKRNEVVSLPKTELQGSDYSNQIAFNGMNIDLPLPFIFTLSPSQSNQTYQGNYVAGTRTIVLYDNAGEHFEPGRDNITNQATKHLMHSESISFLYDPMKDARMIGECDKNDPQVSKIQQGANQLALLNELIVRIRKYKGLRNKEKYGKPFIMIIPKYDAWRESFPIDLTQQDFTYYNNNEMCYYLNVGTVVSVSFCIREKLLDIAPEIVNTCEAFFTTVYYVPVSALGRITEYDETKGLIGIRPRDIKPIWAEVPMLLSYWYADLISAVDSVAGGASIPVEKYKFIGDTLVYSMPVTNERKVVPSNYWGRKVYSPKLQRFIRFPDAPQEASSTSSVNNSNVELDDFWKQ